MSAAMSSTGKPRGPRRLGPFLFVGFGLLAIASVCPVSGKWRPPRRASEVYDPVTDRWSAVKRMPVGLAGARCASIGGLIYVVGGSDWWSNASAHLLRYDPVARTWEELADIPTARVGHDAVALGTDLWVMGGDSLGGTSVEIFDTIAESWSPAADMPTSRAWHRVVDVGGDLYVMGGRESPWPGVETDVLEVLDPVSSLWQTLSPMPAAIADFAAETDGTLIYVIGGSNVVASVTDVSVYDPSQDTWTAAPPMPEEANYLESGIIGQEIIVVGAFGDTSSDRYRFGKDRRRVLSFDTVTGTWVDLSRRIWLLFDVGTTPDGGRLYVFGGRGQSQDD